MTNKASQRTLEFLRVLWEVKWFPVPRMQTGKEEDSPITCDVIPMV